ncbi:MAG: acetate--CoA ligase family protein [Propionibacteriales bacterium]|nr:acetate--CoA ligase family protein [Propionibacteriales bacterium]
MAPEEHPPTDAGHTTTRAGSGAAEARSLEPLLYPRSVVVLGVRRDGAGIGNAVLASIEAGGFTGAIHVVHPTATVLGKHQPHRSVADIGEPVDVAVIAVPARHALAAVQDVAAAGVRAAVVITSGFGENGELGPEGSEAEQAILEIARDHDLCLVGPSSLGLLANDEDVRLNATVSSSVPPRGGLAIASQSGGVGIALLDLARELEVGVHVFVALGNQPDLSGTDLIAAWQADPQVTAAALYVESFGDTSTFARAARRFSEHKPLLAVAGGRSASGAPTVGIDALFAQAGVISCRSAEELVHASRLLTEQPLPGGSRVAIVSNAGGLAILAADAAEATGLTVPELSEALQEQVRRHLSGTIGVSNPIDLGAAASPADLSAVVGLLATSDEIDAVLVVVVPTSVGDPRASVRAVVDARRAGPDVPVLVVALGGLEVGSDESAGVTVFRRTEDALVALHHAATYAAWRTSPRDAPGAVAGDAATDRAGSARAILVGSNSGLSSATQSALLAPYGIAPVGQFARGHVEAAETAMNIGFPVAVKVADPRIAHKTDRGLVRVGLSSPAAVLIAVRQFEEELRNDRVPVLVQPVLGGVELALGLVRHDELGPLIRVAAGGTGTDLGADRTFLMPPVTRQDAARALRSLRIWPLLDGYRGSTPVDIAALEALVVNLGQVAQDVPEVVEIDLDPVLAGPDGAAVVDIKVRVRTTLGPPGPHAPQLSSTRSTATPRSLG